MLVASPDDFSCLKYWRACADRLSRSPTMASKSSCDGRAPLVSLQGLRSAVWAGAHK